MFSISVTFSCFRPKEVAFHLPSVDAIAKDLVKKIEHERRSDGMVSELRLEIGRWSLENAGSMVFDKRLGCLGTNSRRGTLLPLLSHTWRG